MKRESFILTVTGLFTVAAGAAAMIPGVGFFLSPFLKSKNEKWESVGAAESFQPGTTSKVSFPDPSPLPWAGVIAQTAAWLQRNHDGEFVAYSINCTHLGCPVDWVAKADLFMCPCHGGVYTKDGDVAGGPPPRPLTKYQVRVREGKVEILTAELPLA
jgi:menaquinol-cytochrome c reductase iron-sulfur subunit